MLAASHCGSKLLILSQNTTGLPVPFPFFEAEGFLPVTIFEAEGAPPFAFFEGWDDGWSSALRTSGLWSQGFTTLSSLRGSAALQGGVSPSK